MNSLLFLGSGGSMGVPVVSCKCKVCRSDSLFNKRLRPSALLKIGKKQFLLDAGPDFRMQALRYGIDHLDGLLLTHTHFDHIGGLDDLRAFYFLQDKSISCLLSKETCEEVKRCFHYFFHESKCAWLKFQLLKKDFGPVEFEGVHFECVTYFQAEMKVTGYRFDKFAYISDIRDYDESVIEGLKGVDILILSALRYTPTKVHFSIDEAIHFSRKVGAKKTFITHIAHDLEHDETNARLPGDVRLAYDGLEIKF